MGHTHITELSEQQFLAERRLLLRVVLYRFQLMLLVQSVFLLMKDLPKLPLHPMQFEDHQHLR
jgi:hypothetical protein